MNDHLLDILSHSNKDIDNQKLMDYVSNNLSADDQYGIEKEISDSDFISEAVEGLQAFKNIQQASLSVQRLNTDLAKQLEKKKRRSGRHMIKNQPYALLALAIVLILVVVGYLIITRILYLK